MRLRMIVLLPLLLVTGLAGCGNGKTKQSKYQYALEKINKRWDVVRRSFETDEPNIFFGIILKKDFADLVTAMERTYKASNRDEIVPRLKKLAKKFYADTDAVVGRTAGGGAVLQPGKTIEDVDKVIEEAYAEYQKIEKLVK